MAQRKRVLFSASAAVHSVCFMPVYKKLANDSRVEVWFSGGFKSEADDGTESYSLQGFYDPFPIDKGRVIPNERALRETFDAFVCAHSSPVFPPCNAPIVQIFHGVSFKNINAREKVLKSDLLCLPGRYHAELYRRQGLIRPGGSKCLLTGFAKVDSLAQPADRSPFLRSMKLDPRLPTLLFAPTGEKHNALDVMGREVIAAIDKTRGFNLLVKPHDHPKKKIDWFKELAPLENERIRVVRDFDVVPYLEAADLLITDASSVAIEYTLLDRPMIFLDVPNLMQQIAKRSPAADLDTYGRKIGTVVSGPDTLADAVREVLAHPEAREQGKFRRAAAAHLFHAPGGAAERVAAVVRHAAGIEPALPDDIQVLAPDAAAE